jgi:DNA polymerase-3 subunit beta
LKIAGAELNVSAEDIDYSNKAEERLTVIPGDDMQIRVLVSRETNLQSDMIMLEMSLPNRAGILTQFGLEK